MLSRSAVWNGGNGGKPVLSVTWTMTTTLVWRKQRDVWGVSREGKQRKEETRRSKPSWTLKMTPRHSFDWWSHNGSLPSTKQIVLLLVGWLCWGLTSQSTIFQSCRDGAIASWVINQYFRGVKCLAQGHNTAAVGLEPRTSRSGVRHSTTEPPRSPSITVDGESFETTQEVCQGWVTHFQILALPLQKENFDKEYKELVDQDIESIQSICEAAERPVKPVTQEEVQKTLNKLKNNKAMDSMGLCSEHLNLGGQTVTEFLTGMLNCLIRSKAVSVVLKEGLLTPIYKKGDPTDPGNYRGVTVTLVLLKVLEHVVNSRHNKKS